MQNIHAKFIPGKKNIQQFQKMKKKKLEFPCQKSENIK
jgi:hypothetical protein